MKLDIKNRMKAAVSTAKVAAVKYGPKAAIVAGVGCLIAGTVVACIQARSVDEVIEEKNVEVDNIKVDFEAGLIDEREAGRKITRAWGVCLWKFVQKFWAVVALEGLGIVLITKGVKGYDAALAAGNALLLAKIQEQEEMEERIRNLYGEDVLDKIKYGDSITVTHIGNETSGEGQVLIEEVYDDDPKQFDFTWTSGMGDFSDTDESMNRRTVNRIIEAFNMSTQTYGIYGTRLNEVYRAFDKEHPKISRRNELMNMVFPILPDHDNRIRVICKELPGTARPEIGKTARDLRVIFETRPVPLGSISLDDDLVLARRL